MSYSLGGAGVQSPEPALTQAKGSPAIKPECASCPGSQGPPSRSLVPRLPAYGKHEAWGKGRSMEAHGWPGLSLMAPGW